MDTTGLALSSLMEAEHPEAPRIFSHMFQQASFSGANWKTSVLMCKVCAEHANPGYAPGLLAALDKKLGRHDDGERALVARAYAQCAGADAVPLLKERMANITDVRADCERAGLLAGLVQAAPGDEAVAADAKGTLGKLLAGRMGSMEFGAAASLLQAVHEKKHQGFAELAASVLERGRADKYAKAPLVKWLEENRGAFA